MMKKKKTLKCDGKEADEEETEAEEEEKDKEEEEVEEGKLIITYVHKSKHKTHNICI